MPASSPALLATEELAPGLEATVFAAPRSLSVDLRSVLPELPPASLRDLLLIPVCLRARCDLVAVGADVAAEKDRCLLRVVAFAAAARAALAARGAWADYADPCSGLAAHGPAAAAPYPEVDAAELLLRYRTGLAGTCRVLLHPRWGSAVYPATLFSTAPLPDVADALRAAAAAVAAWDDEERTREAAERGGANAPAARTADG